LGVNSPLTGPNAQYGFDLAFGPDGFVSRSLPGEQSNVISDPNLPPPSL
jgi:hypothetical protein